MSIGPSFSIITQALKENQIKPKSWREELRRITQNGQEVCAILLELARGNAWSAQLADGRISAPVLPSSDVRLRAAMFLHEAMFGKAVPQTEVIKAETETRELEAIRALSDDELLLEASKIIDAQKVNEITSSNQAEYVEILPVTDVPLSEVINKIWLSKREPE